MSDIVKMASLDSPAAVWIIFLFIAVFMGFLFYVALMNKDHAKDMAGKPLDENDLLLDHEIDGIRELDNALPPWWKNLFYITIVFSAVYILGYHVFELWNLPEAEYVDELKTAGVYEEETAGEDATAKEGGAAPEKVVISPEEAKALALKTGKKVFAQKCASCHAGDGGGGVGPNLCDEFWIHGGDKESIVKVVTNGVITKGMIPWKGQLNKGEIASVADYILSLQGSAPASPKAPQGERVTP